MSDDLTDLVSDALADVRAELVRVDGKAGSLLALATAVLAVLTARTTGAALPPVVAVATWAAAGVFAAAVAVLLAAVGPRLAPLRPRRTGAGTAPPWVRYAAAGDLHAHLAAVAADGPAGWRMRLLSELSPIVASKYRRLWWAVRLLLTGLVLLAVAAVLAAVTQ